MKQLLIVNSNKAVDAGLTSNAVTDLSGLQEGAITLFELGADKSLAETSAKPATKNFGIALGRGANKPAFVIPEVDIDTLEIIHTYPFKGEHLSVTFTTPGNTGDNAKDTEYGIRFVKKGTVPNERNLFDVTIFVKAGTVAATAATALADAINNKANELFNVTATVDTAAVTITGNDYSDYEVKFVDGLSAITATSYIHARKPIGDAAYISELAQKCAADKGFVYLDQASKDIYPGYPEKVETIGAMNTSGTSAYIKVGASTIGNSTVGYKIFNLHFATGRKAGKQTDERVWQYVHIAIPLTKADGSADAAALSSLNAILPAGVFKAVTAPKAATSDAPSSGYLTKAVADTLYDPI